MGQFDPELFKLAREQNGFSQKELVVGLDIKQAAISKYESGSITPSDAALQQLADRLRYPVDFFYQEIFENPTGLIYHRKRTALSAKERARIEAEVRLRTLDVHKLFDKAGLKSDILPREGRTPTQMARDLRRHWGMDQGPIENLTALLEKHNIIILSFEFHLPELDGFVIPLESDIVCIALNADSCFSPDRLRYTLCHELGHALLHKGVFPDKTTEKEADAFAAEFLAPGETISPELACPLTLQKLMVLKTRWRMSMASLIFRAHALGEIGDGVYRRTMIFLSSCGYRKKEPACGVLPEHPDLVLRLMKRYIEETPDALNQLHLTRERFGERYPGLIWEGQSSMTPMIS